MPDLLKPDNKELNPEKNAFESNDFLSKIVTSFKNKTILTSFTSFSGWGNGTKEILEQFPQVWTRGLLYILVGGAAIIIPWSMLYKIDETGTAKGRVEPQGQTMKLDAVTSGSVLEVKVKEGQTVTKGQSLLILESDQAQTELRQIQEKLDGQIARLDDTSLVKNQLSVTMATQMQQNQAQLLEKQTQIAQAQQNLQSLQNNYQSQFSEKAAQLSQAAQTLEDRQANLNLQKQEKIDRTNQAQQTIIDNIATANMGKIRLADAQSELTRYNSLYKTGAVAQTKSIEAEGVVKERKLAMLQAQANTRQSQLRYKEELSSYNKLMQQAQSDITQAKIRLKEQQNIYQRSVSQLQSDIAQAQLRLKEQQNSYRTLSSSGKLAILRVQEQIKNIDTQAASLKSEIVQTRLQIEVLKQQLEKRNITAPIDGVVFQLPIQKSGAMVQPGRMVAEIAPTGSPLIIRAQIATADSGSLRLGLPVKLKFDAYPFQDYGVLSGKVVEISPTSAESSGAATYNLQISLARNCLQHGDKCIPLRPGETVTAEVIIRQRKIADFFLDPFRKLQQGDLKL